jgi:hypothetical protein
MSIRSDITIDWSLSPRIIEVASPSVQVVIQDLIDTLRYLEFLPQNMGYPYIVDSFGKVDLGGGIVTNITLILQDAKIAFEARGSWTACEIIGGNLAAVDSGGSPISPIETTAFVQVNYAQSTSAGLAFPADLETILKMTYNKATKSGDIVTIYESDGITVWKQFSLASGGRVEQ